MVVRMRHTRGHTGNRRSHHALKKSNLIPCEKCRSLRLMHRACEVCGDYRGKTVIDVISKVEKRQAKNKLSVKNKTEATEKT